MTLRPSHRTGGPDTRRSSTAPSTSSGTGSTAPASPTPRSPNPATTSSSPIPGVGPEEAIKLVGTTAELRFRQVMAMEPTQLPQDQLATEAPTPGASPSAAPSSPSSSEPTQSVSAPSRPRHRPRGPRHPHGHGAVVGPDLARPGRPRRPRPRSSPTRATTAGGRARRRRPSAQPEEDPNAGINTQGIDPAVLKQFDALDCTDPNKRGQGAQDDPDKQYAACETDGTFKYVLDVAEVVGTDIDTALRRVSSRAAPSGSSSSTSRARAPPSGASSPPPRSTRLSRATRSRSSSTAS